MIFSIIVFLCTGLVIYMGVYHGVPGLMAKGMAKIHAFWLVLWAPVFLLVPISLLHYVIAEGGDLRWQALQERYLLHSPDGLHYVWVVVAIVFTLVVEESLQPISRYLAKKRLLAPPDYLPAPFNPLKRFTFPPTTFFDVELKGNYKLLAVFIPLHLLAMISEEIMWRGYILPLQMEVFGNVAWLVNGLMWAFLVHMCLKWHFVAMLPGMLVVPFIAQLTGSTIAAFYVHAIPNALLWIVLFFGVRNKGGKSRIMISSRCPSSGSPRGLTESMRCMLRLRRPSL